MSLCDELVDAVKNGEEQWRRDYSRFVSDAHRLVVISVLRVLVDKHFGSVGLDSDAEEVDYHYACEGLAQDVCDALRELERKP